MLFSLEATLLVLTKRGSESVVARELKTENQLPQRTAQVPVSLDLDLNYLSLRKSLSLSLR